MKVFLTGGTGFIGQAIVRAARRRGWDLAVLVRDRAAAPARWIPEQGCTLVEGDVTASGALREALAGAEVVIHNAGVYAYGASRAERARMVEVNVGGTDAVLRAAAEAGVPRTVYVSTAWALGPTGATPEDETHRHPGRFHSLYEESKVRAHEIALAWRDRGLPLSIAMPNAVVGANDHSVFGYLLRLYLLRALPPIAYGGDAVYAPVDVEALADGICLVAERAPMGQDYLFCGQTETLRGMLERWRRYPGGARRMVWLPRGVMKPLVAPLEPLERALRLAPFLSRDTVNVTGVSLNYHSGKARRDLGWTHPPPEAMWDRIVAEQRSLMAAQGGFLDRLRHQPVASAHAPPM